MALWIIGPTKTTNPAGGCRPCTSAQRPLCPSILTISIGCGNCAQPTLLAYRSLGVLTCWTSGHCNPNACCPTLSLDPWADYRAGRWVSSLVIPIYAECASGGPQATTLRASMFPVNLSKPVTTGASTICGTTQVATITVFDDGSFIIT